MHAGFKRNGRQWSKAMQQTPQEPRGEYRATNNRNRPFTIRSCFGKSGRDGRCGYGIPVYVLWPESIPARYVRLSNTGMMLPGLRFLE